MWFQLFYQAEFYHFLFDAVIKLHQWGLDWSTTSHVLFAMSMGLVNAGECDKGSEGRGPLERLCD